jgi:hypothetical protein
MAEEMKNEDDAEDCCMPVFETEEIGE